MRGWIKLHNELHNLYSSSISHKIKEYEMGGTYDEHGRGEKCIQNFSRNPEGMRPLGRSTRT